MSSTVAIVQPYEYMSVAEQEYVLTEYARQMGLSISQFIGESDLLHQDNPAIARLLENIARGIIKQILLLDGIVEKLPKGFCDTCRALGCDVMTIKPSRAIISLG
jgi:hypothetical protein